ncbi:MAG: 3-deoxy-D-manno-octulosonic acid kinase [Pseudomonadota bacterium]
MDPLLGDESPAPEPIKVLRTATRGSAGQGALLVNPEAGVEVDPSWFDPAQWAAGNALVGEARGRGKAQVFEHSGRRFVLRHYRRGGLVARVSADRYLWMGEDRTRPVRELKLNLRMHAAGLPVPLPVAARFERQGFSYSGDLITELLPDTQTLAQRLDEGEVGLSTWAAIGRCLRRFQAYGLYHSDLNAHNILLRAADEVFLIDFDNGRRRTPGLWVDANLARLRRSLDKLEDPRPQRRFDDAQWQCLLAACL